MVRCRQRSLHHRLVCVALCWAVSRRVAGITALTTARWQPSRHFPLRVSAKEMPSKVNGRDSANGESVISNNRQKVGSRSGAKPYQILSEYLARLWTETNPNARNRIANDKAALSIKRVQHIFRGEQYCDFSSIPLEHQQNLLDACDSILSIKEDQATTQNDASSRDSSEAVASIALHVPDNGGSYVAPTKKERSVLFGAAMGAVVACWVFSGNLVFTGLFTLMTIIGQLEYYRMVMNTGVYPARKVSVIGAASMFVTVSAR
jgi:hypothetical protein